MDRLKSTLITLTFLFFTGNSWAAIVSTTGMTVISAPTSVEPGQLESNTTVWAFTEQQSYTLTTDLAVDEVVSTSATGLLAAGTEIDSYFFHVDPVGDSGLAADGVEISGTVTFDTKILGLIWTGVPCPNNCPTSFMYLDASDYLGAPSTTYPTGGLGRGLEVEEQYTWTRDFITLSSDGYSLTTLSSAAAPLYSDQLRVITASAVPLPMSVWLLGSGLIGLVGFGRKRLK